GEEIAAAQHQERAGAHLLELADEEERGDAVADDERRLVGRDEGRDLRPGLRRVGRREGADQQRGEEQALRRAPVAAPHRRRREEEDLAPGLVLGAAGRARTRRGRRILRAAGVSGVVRPYQAVLTSILPQAQRNGNALRVRRRRKISCRVSSDGRLAKSRRD